MSNTLILNQPFVNIGLTTQTYTVPTAADGQYNVKYQVSEIPPSGLSVVVNKNGSPVYTATAPTINQIGFKFKFPIVLAAADVVTVVLSSASAIDAQFNSVKSIISIGQGA